MTQPVYPRFNVQELPPPIMVIRSRQEISTRDTTNARQFEHWQTDGKAMTTNRPDVNAQAPFHDTLPINSRSVDRNYSSQVRFDAGGHRLGQNAYFDKYDPSYDSRNAVRELQAVVYEDKATEGVRESGRLLGRFFDNRWMTEAEQAATVEASISLRPIRDDYTKMYK